MQKRNLLLLLLAVVWLVACFAFFQFGYRYHLCYQEQNQLFLMSSSYLWGYFSKPAWLACMLGDFLTQFYYYLYAGPLILSLSLLLVGVLTYYSFKRLSAPTWLSALLGFVFATLGAVFSFQSDYRLSSVLALAGGWALFLLWSLRRMPIWLSALTILIGGILAHWLFGYGMWLFLILALVAEIQHVSGLVRLLPAIGSTVVVIVVVAFTKPLYFLPYSQLFTTPGMGRVERPNFLLERELGVATEYALGNYAQVVRMVDRQQEPLDIELFYYNLVMAQRGELPQVLLKHGTTQLGTFYSVGPTTPAVVINAMDQLYWALGDVTFTERAAMLAHVFSPQNRSRVKLRRLAEVGIVEGDTAAARKYLRVLSKSWVDRDWANHLLAGDAEALQPYKKVQQFAITADTLRLNDNAHNVMVQLLQRNPNNVVARDYLLCSDLLLKDLDGFKRDYDRFVMSQGTRLSTPLYQQALCICLTREHAPESVWQHYGISGSELQNFADYNRRRGDAAFAHTYYYYFDKIKAPSI
jgi:hypothetical protein